MPENIRGIKSLRGEFNRVTFAERQKGVNNFGADPREVPNAERSFDGLTRDQVLGIQVNFAGDYVKIFVTALVKMIAPGHATLQLDASEMHDGHLSIGEDREFPGRRIKASADLFSIRWLIDNLQRLNLEFSLKEGNDTHSAAAIVYAGASTAQ